VRVVAATNRDLRAMIAESRFRADLFFRLNGISVTIPPLRSRRADVAPLARHFAALAAAKVGRPAPRLTPAAVTLLEGHAWPGNVRELRAAIERVVVLTRAAEIDADDVARSDPATFGAAAHVAAPRATSDAGLRSQVRSLEEARIREALEKTGGNQTRAARLLGIARQTLLTRMDEFGIPRPGKRDDQENR
jgi:DNA-binding NtrC family response regulator